jgi:hypothetical protein
LGVTDSAEVENFIEEEGWVFLEQEDEAWVFGHGGKQFLQCHGGLAPLGRESAVEDEEVVIADEVVLGDLREGHGRLGGEWVGLESVQADRVDKGGLVKTLAQIGQEFLSHG